MKVVEVKFSETEDFVKGLIDLENHITRNRTQLMVQAMNIGLDNLIKIVKITHKSGFIEVKLVGSRELVTLERVLDSDVVKVEYYYHQSIVKSIHSIITAVKEKGNISDLELNKHLENITSEMRDGETWGTEVEDYVDSEESEEFVEDFLHLQSLKSRICILPRGISKEVLLDFETTLKGTEHIQLSSKDKKTVIFVFAEESDEVSTCSIKENEALELLKEIYDIHTELFLKDTDESNSILNILATHVFGYELKEDSGSKGKNVDDLPQIVSGLSNYEFIETILESNQPMMIMPKGLNTDSEEIENDDCNCPACQMRRAIIEDMEEMGIKPPKSFIKEEYTGNMGKEEKSEPLSEQEELLETMKDTFLGVLGEVSNFLETEVPRATEKSKDFIKGKSEQYEVPERVNKAKLGLAKILTETASKLSQKEKESEDEEDEDAK